MIESRHQDRCLRARAKRALNSGPGSAVVTKHSLMSGFPPLDGGEADLDQPFEDVKRPSRRTCSQVRTVGGRRWVNAMAAVMVNAGPAPYGGSR